MTGTEARDRLGAATHPLIYEINTWPWLTGLSRSVGNGVDLGSVPDEQWDRLAAMGVDAVWFMGIWERSPAGTAIALGDASLMAELARVLPDLSPDDVVGSPYCIRDYTVDGHLGGPDGLATARRELTARGIGLLLDFVPNHVAPDHSWTTGHPDLFVRGIDDDLARDPTSFRRVGDRVFACGRDPYFPAWQDVMQLNAFHPDLRASAARTLVTILDQCDGVRCDMAMLLLNDVFTRTWGDRVGVAPATEYWTDVITAARAQHPDAVFIAEAYWDLEARLQDLGFDYCYDKRLYDRQAHAEAEAIRLHLCADLDYQQGLLRFLENHDEPRAASVFDTDRALAESTVALTQAGARLVHDGQLAGLHIRLPVQLGRAPDEPVDPAWESAMRIVLDVLSDPTFHRGSWQLCDRWGDAACDAWSQLLAWAWQPAPDDVGSRWLIVVNHGPDEAAGHVRAPQGWAELRDVSVTLTDVAHDTGYERAGNDLLGGLYVRLDPWDVHLFRVESIDSLPLENP